MSSIIATPKTIYDASSLITSSSNTFLIMTVMVTEIASPANIESNSEKFTMKTLLKIYVDIPNASEIL
jgi:phosphopantothenoylcysteine synthetase/decarboxylase